MNNQSEEKQLKTHPWEMMSSPIELEAWIEINNQELQSLMGSKPSVGHGICFNLLHGGKIYFHTNSDGDVLLDVEPDADWVIPVLLACTKVSAPRGQIWCLPHQDLLQVLWGLNGLIESSHLVLSHAYRIEKR